MRVRGHSQKTNKNRGQTGYATRLGDIKGQNTYVET
nr:MAG TPA: hypothetical protein [Caudoviricetes sp.]